MAFGLLVAKWRILHTPINVKLSNLKKMVNAICRLHNFCIENREATTKISRIYRVPKQQHHPHEPTELGYIPTDAPSIVSREGTSYLRELLARRVANNHLSRPLSDSTKRALEHRRSSLYEWASGSITNEGGLRCRPDSKFSNLWPCTLEQQWYSLKLFF
jgi:hypothetical protein